MNLVVDGSSVCGGLGVLVALGGICDTRARAFLFTDGWYLRNEFVEGSGLSEACMYLHNKFREWVKPVRRQFGNV